MINDNPNPAPKSTPSGDSLQTSPFIHEHNQSEFIWLRLSGLAQGAQRLMYLEKALQINPHNKQTLRLIERLNPNRSPQAAHALPASPPAGRIKHHSKPQ